MAANADETAGKEETPLLGSGMVGAPREEIRLGLARLCAFLFEFFRFNVCPKPVLVKDRRLSRMKMWRKVAVLHLASEGKLFGAALWCNY